jgi:hypothetical protein
VDDGHASSGSSRRVLVRGYWHAQISQIPGRSLTDLGRAADENGRHLPGCVDVDPAPATPGDEFSVSERRCLVIRIVTNALSSSSGKRSPASARNVSIF